MAEILSIEIRQPLRRVLAGNVGGWLHGFFPAADAKVVAVVEKDDGTITYYYAHDIVFIEPFSINTKYERNAETDIVKEAKSWNIPNDWGIFSFKETKRCVRCGQKANLNFQEMCFNCWDGLWKVLTSQND